MKAILEAAGTSMNNVVKTTVYLEDFEDYDGMNEIYTRYFPEIPPVRCTVEVSKMYEGIKIEIEAIAVMPKKDEQLAIPLGARKNVHSM